MLRIRLLRTGKKNQPSYRIVVKERRSKRQGKYLENLGSYQPLLDPPGFQINQQRYHYWIKHGAQASDTVRKLVARFKKKT